MKPIQKIALGVAGITALAIGAFILAAFGAAMLAGIVRPALRQTAVFAALTVFLAFPVGRIVGLLADGTPSGDILGALVLELAIAGFCLFAFRRGTAPAITGFAMR